MKQKRIEELAREAVDLIARNAGYTVADIITIAISDALAEQRTLCIDCDEPSGRYQHRCEKCLQEVENVPAPTNGILVG